MKNIIRGLLLNEQYEEAEKFINEQVTAENYDDEIALFDATIGLYYGDEERVWNACANGLTLNSKNYELYAVLGEYYFNRNIDQAYLCYENALYYCTQDEDRQQILDMIEMMKRENEISVRAVSIVILSYNLREYTEKCIESIRNTTLESSRQIIVVDNASIDGSVDWLGEQEDIVLVENKENAGFPKGCNQGIKKANPDNDIFLLNNDTIMIDNSLFWLRMGLYENKKTGATGSRSNAVSNLQQVLTEKKMSMEEWIQYGILNNVPVEYPYEEKLYLVGFAMLIKREVINLVGDLDERFTPGNFEDNDYGLRILESGYQNILCRNSFIYHYGSKSFKKEVDEFQNILDVNGEKFRDKWGLNPYRYSYPWVELIDMIEEAGKKELNILDLACGCGAALGLVKGIYPNTKVYGVEREEKSAKFAMQFGEVIHGDIQKAELPWEEEFFDYVILPDILQKLSEPVKVLGKLKKHIKKGGQIIVSMPNVKHFSVIFPLLFKDELKYTDGGVLDKENIRMYTGTEMKNLIEEAGYRLKDVRYTRNGEPGKTMDKIIDQLLAMTGCSNRTPYLVYQYLIKAEH